MKVPTDKITNPTDNMRELANLYHQLRSALIAGEIAEAEALCERIGFAKEETSSTSDNLAKYRLPKIAIRNLLEGIQAVQENDLISGIAYLQRITGEVCTHSFVEWIAWLWVGWGCYALGDGPNMLHAAQAALDIAKALGQHAQGVSYRVLAQAEFRLGDLSSALEHLSHGLLLLQRGGDRRELARILLLQTHVSVAKGHKNNDFNMALQAIIADPSWPEPLCWLAQQAIRRGDLDKAEEILQIALRLAPIDDVVYLQAIITQIREHKIPSSAVEAFFGLRNGIFSPADVERLNKLIDQWPNFLPLRELLAWYLLRRGLYDESTAHFEILCGQNLGPEMQRSVKVALNVLAQLIHKHGKSCSRPWQAVAAIVERLEMEAAKSIAGAEEKIATTAAEETTISSPNMIEMQLKNNLLESKKTIFDGDLKHIGFADLIQFCQNSRLTGTLVLISDQGVGAVFLQSGMITGALSPHYSNVGLLLLAKGVVTAEILETVTGPQTDHPERLIGSLLVEKGIVSRETMQKTLVEQVHQSFREMMSWEQGEFAFSPDTEPTIMATGVDIQLDTQMVLLEVARVIDEAKREVYAPVS